MPTPRLILAIGDWSTSSGAQTLTAGGASYSLTGLAASSKRNYSNKIDVGSFTLTGQSNTLKTGKDVNAELGTVSLNGQSILLTPKFIGVFEAGNLSLTGLNTTLNKDSKVAGVVESFILAGQPATLTHTPSANSVLSFSASTYSNTEEACSYIEVTVTRTISITGVVSATLTYTDDGVAPNKALVNEHYAKGAVDVSFADGVGGDVVIKIPTIYTGLVDDKQFTLSLTAPVNCTVGAPGAATLTIERTSHSTKGVGYFSNGDVNWHNPPALTVGAAINQTGNTTTETFDFKEYNNKQIVFSTCANKTFENCFIHDYDGRLLDFTGTTEVTVRNCFIQTDNALGAMGSQVAGIWYSYPGADGVPANVSVLGNWFDDCYRGIEFYDCYDNNNIKANYNHQTNPNDRTSGVGSGMHFITLAWTGITENCEFRHNSHYFTGFKETQEDVISTFESGGTAVSPVKIENNVFFGMGSDSATGIICGDAYVNTTAYVHARYNVIVNVGHVGMAIFSGNNHDISYNKIFNSRNDLPLVNATPTYDISADGISVNNNAPSSPTPANATVFHNEVSFYYSSTSTPATITFRAFYFAPGAGYTQNFNDWTEDAGVDLVWDGVTGNEGYDILFWRWRPWEVYGHIPGVRIFSASNGSQKGVRGSIDYDNAAKTLKYKEGGDTSYGSPVSVSAADCAEGTGVGDLGRLKELQSGNGQNIWVIVDPGSLPTTNRTDNTILITGVSYDRWMYAGLAGDGLLTSPLNPPTVPTIVANKGTINLLGQDTSLIRIALTTVDLGTFSFNGQAIQLAKGQKVIGGAGSHVLDGKAVSLVNESNIDLNAGAYTWQGQTVDLNRGLSAISEVGSLQLLGKDVSLVSMFNVAFDAASFNLSGLAANFIRPYKAQGEFGSFIFNGQVVSLTPSTVDPSLLAGIGTILLSGKDVPFYRGYSNQSEVGVFDFLGNSVPLTKYAVSAGGKGDFASTGQDISFSRIYVALAESGAIQLLGKDAQLVTIGNIKGDLGNFVFTGQAGSFVSTRSVNAGAGSLVTSGKDVSLVFTPDRKLLTDVIPITFSGKDVLFAVDRVSYPIAAETGVFIFVGYGLDLKIDTLYADYVGIDYEVLKLL